MLKACPVSAGPDEPAAILAQVVLLAKLPANWPKLRAPTRRSRARLPAKECSSSICGARLRRADVGNGRP